MTQRQLEKGSEMENFYLDNIVPRNDGGILLIGEQYYVTTSTYRDMYGYWYTINYYHYDDVIITSISPDGKVEWSSVVYKRQVSDNPGQLSYFDMVTGEFLYLFYEYREKGESINIYYQPVDMLGTVGKRKPMFPEYSSGDTFFRSFSKQISNNEAILVYQQRKGKIFSLIKIGF